MLTMDGCRSRQERFRERLSQAGIDAAVVTDPRDVYYLTGLLPANFPVFLYLPVGNGGFLVCHTDEGEVAVADRLTYSTNILYTLNPDPLAHLAGVLELRLALYFAHGQGDRSTQRAEHRRPPAPRGVVRAAGGEA